MTEPRSPKGLWIIYFRYGKSDPFIPYVDVHENAVAHTKKSSVNPHYLQQLYGRGNVRIVQVLPKALSGESRQ